MISELFTWLRSRFASGREFFRAADALCDQPSNTAYLMEFTGCGRIVGTEYRVDPCTALALSGKFKNLGLSVRITDDGLIYPVYKSSIMLAAVRKAFGLSLADMAWLFDPAMYEGPMTINRIIRRLNEYGQRLG